MALRVDGLPMRHQPHMNQLDFSRCPGEGHLAIDPQDEKYVESALEARPTTSGTSCF